jgi:hypothetical protein
MSKSKPRPIEAPPASPRRDEGVRLLMSAEDVRRALGGISNPQIRRLEKLGLLRPVRLTRSLKATRYYTIENVAEVARGQDVSDLKPEDMNLPPRRSPLRKPRQEARASR